MDCPGAAFLNMEFTCSFYYSLPINNYMVIISYGDGDTRNWIQTTTNKILLYKSYNQSGTYLINVYGSNFSIPMSLNHTITGSYNNNNNNNSLFRHLIND